MIVLNAAVAYQLTQFKKDVDVIIKKGVNKDEAIFQVLKKYILESERVLFEGDNYSKEWHAEAKKRKLCNLASVPESISLYLKFAKKVQIESRVLGDLAMNHIVPIAITYMTSLIENVKGLKEIYNNTEYERLAGARKEVIVTISDHISMIKKLVSEMVDARRKANVIEDNYKKAIAYESKVKPYLDEIRNHIDKLELVVDNEMWPLPKYRELLFTR
jgi:glutamine synthetase